MKKNFFFSSIAALFLAGFLFIAATPATTSEASAPEVTSCEDDVKCDCSLATATIKFKVVSVSGNCYKIELCTNGAIYPAISCVPLFNNTVYKACVRKNNAPNNCFSGSYVEVLYAEKQKGC